MICLFVVGFFCLFSWPLQGIYRVNGAKSRVEKLCQAFENGKDLVELSDHSPHDISNVLKLYLRQVERRLCSNELKTSRSFSCAVIFTLVAKMPPLVVATAPHSLTK